jgi:glycine/D-amino acid oxidase-like deaminating enzyme
VIGAGVVGLAVAWLLQNQGHAVCLIDPQLGKSQAEGAGSGAALGLLMAQVYRRSSGRGWRLRQRSLQLWQDWRRQLLARGHDLPWRPGLLQLASNVAELQAQQRLAAERQARGLPLQLLSSEALQQLQPVVPAAAIGGLFSPLDGQLDPIPAMAALLADARRLGLECRGEAVLQLEALLQVVPAGLAIRMRRLVYGIRMWRSASRSAALRRRTRTVSSASAAPVTSATATRPLLTTL